MLGRVEGIDLVRVSRKRDGVGSPFLLEIESSAYDEQTMAYAEDFKPPYWPWLQCIRPHVDTADTLPVSDWREMG